MAQNYIESGKQFQYTVPNATTVDSGQVVIKNHLRGVALGSGAAGDKVIVATQGVFTLPKAAEDIDQGTALYYDATAENVTKTPDADATAFIGYAHEDKLTADATINVLIGGTDVALGQIEGGAATNGQVLKWNDTTKVWAPGADATE